MVHLEQITTFQVVSVDDGYGGQVDEQLEHVADAPTWATVTQESGTMTTYKGRPVSDYNYRIEHNYKDNFDWRTDYVIYYRDIYIRVVSIVETTRLRGITILGNHIPSETWPTPSM